MTQSCLTRLLVCAAFLLPGVLAAAETNLKAQEEVVFYPCVAERMEGTTNLWRAKLRGCVFEPEKRRLMIGALREALELKTEELTSDESSVFDERARLFLADHERGRKIFIRLGTNEFFAGKSGADGRFSCQITFPGSGDTGFAAALKPGDSRNFSGQFVFLEDEGLSVISDIDDTIKITEVRDRKATLRNTFLRPFEPVPGMARFYQTLADERNASFHYVSASPWQLYQPLSAFIASSGFPAGAFELKEFRWKDRSFFSLFSNPGKYKRGIIEPLLKRFPKRKFVLIGDSGERDPEIYGELARKFPDQVLRILIRDVTNEPSDSTRYANALRNVPTGKWQIFREPGEIKCLCE